MDNGVKLKIESMYNILMEKPNLIYEVFKGFFGEEFVDIQGYPSLDEYTSSLESLDESLILSRTSPLSDIMFNNIFILVRFPEVRVTNENDKYIDIWELYAQCPITYTGKSRGYFALNRSKYNMFQLLNNYMHSHISSIPLHNLTSFQSPCLGSGPIRDTLALLSADEDFDELRWQLFCLELSKYVEVESLDGGPYNRLEQLGEQTLTPGEVTWPMTPYSNVPETIYLSAENIQDFTEWLISKRNLEFDYNGSFGIAMSFIQWMVFISNEFIEWYNLRYSQSYISASYTQLLESETVKRGIIKNNRLYYDNSRVGRSYSRYIGQKVCTFKGQDVLFSITDIEEPNNNFSTFLNVAIAETIYKSIVQLVNYEYSNNSPETQALRDDKEYIFI